MKDKCFTIFVYYLTLDFNTKSRQFLPSLYHDARTREEPEQPPRRRPVGFVFVRHAFTNKNKPHRTSAGRLEPERRVEKVDLSCIQGFLQNSISNYTFSPGVANNPQLTFHTDILEILVLDPFLSPRRQARKMGVVGV